MSLPLPDPFDSLLISDCKILARPAGKDAAGQRTAPPELVTTVKARKSTLRRYQEWKGEKKAGLARYVIFMRPYPALTIKHWLEIAGVQYDVQHIDAVSGDAAHGDVHHYEVSVEKVEP